MKPLRESNHPLRSLLDAAHHLDDRDDDAARGRVRERLRAASPRRSWLWLAFGAAVAAGVLITTQLLAPATRVLEAQGQFDGVSWTWVGKDDGARRTTERVTVGEGVMAVRATRSIRVVTPGAEIDAVAAHFRVMVAAGGATSVTVEEGEVVIRSGRDMVRLPAGERWASLDSESADAAFHHWALQLEREGRSEAAVTVLEALTPVKTIWSELGFYDAARICLARGEVARARQFLDGYARRYGEGGVLQREMEALLKNSAP